MTTERPDKLGVVRFLQPGKYADTARLTRMQGLDPNRIPVIFVHGLQDTPASRVPMINALRDDPEIRRRYQFWVFSYPSGYPYPTPRRSFAKSSMSVARAFPSRQRAVVLIGHSMGGMISRLMVTDAGDKSGGECFGSARANRIPGRKPKAAGGYDRCLIIGRNVRRVIFISTPHRGSEWLPTGLARSRPNW